MLQIRTALLSALLTGSFLAQPVGAGVLWDADFDDPGILGLPPPATGPPDYPTFLRPTNGTYTVVAASGDLTNQPVEIADTETFHVPRMRFDLPTAGIPIIDSGTMLIEFDMLTSDVPGVDDECVTSGVATRCQEVILQHGGIAIVAAIWFLGDGTLALISGTGAVPEFTPLPYTLGEAIHFVVLIDMDGGDAGYTVWADSALLGTVGFGTQDPEFGGLSFGGHLSRDLFAVDDVFIEQDPVLLPECQDGLDNDGDSFIDFPADSGCFQAGSKFEERQCDDGIDNDTDTFIDFPADSDCDGGWDASEGSGGACGLGVELLLALPLLQLVRRRQGN